MIDHVDRAHLLAQTHDIWTPLRGERVCITGGTGFVGTWLLEAFAAANRHFGLNAHAVVLSRDPAGFAARAAHLAADPAIVLVQGDIADVDLPRGRFAFVIHAATQRWFDPDARRPLGILDVDFGVTRRLLEFARAAGTRRFLFTSSGAVYGRQPDGLERLGESYPGAPAIADPRAAYGEGKRLSEFLCARYAAQYGFDAIVARLFAFVGPHLPLDEGYAVGNFIADALAGRPIRVGGDGTPVRSYLYAADLAVWLWHLLLRAPADRPYNVGSPEPLSIRTLAGIVRDVCNRELPVEVALSERAGQSPSRYVPDTERVRRVLGLEPLVTLPDAIRRTYAWHRSHRMAGDTTLV